MTNAPPPAAPPWREVDRLAALAGYAIMDTAPERDFDDLVRVAALICGAPIALVSLVDGERQWFKAAFGLDVRETPRDIAFCAHAIQQRGVFVVEDASQDARFADNPFVTGDTHLRFYAGEPVETPEGLPLGTLCVLDTEARALSASSTSPLRRWRGRSPRSSSCAGRWRSRNRTTSAIAASWKARSTMASSRWT